MQLHRKDDGKTFTRLKTIFFYLTVLLQTKWPSFVFDFPNRSLTIILNFSDCYLRVEKLKYLRIVIHQTANGNHEIRVRFGEARSVLMSINTLWKYYALRRSINSKDPSVVDRTV